MDSANENAARGTAAENQDSGVIIRGGGSGKPVSTRKFYKTVYTVEVLSEEPLEGYMPTLPQLHDMIMFGDCSGRVTTDGSVEINSVTTAKKLIEQGSDPEFFMLDENGCDNWGDEDDE